MMLEEVRMQLQMQTSMQPMMMVTEPHNPFGYLLALVEAQIVENLQLRSEIAVLEARIKEVEKFIGH